MTSLSALKKASQKTLETLAKPEEKGGDKSRFERDSRLWKPTFDPEKGTGSAVIRFLPCHPDEIDELPYVTLYSHSFKGSTGKWYIQNSLSSIGERDCVGELNYRLYNSGIESDKEVAKKMKRKTTHYANVLIVKDAAHPELQGKVMIYEFGAAINNIIKAAVNPVIDDTLDEDERPVAINPFDVFEGADFVIKMTPKALKNDKGENITVPNYDTSSFKKPSALFGGDEEKIEEIWNQCHKLRPFISPDKFKSKAELEKILVNALGTRVGSGVLVIERKGDVDDDQSDSADVIADLVGEAPETKKPAGKKPPKEPTKQAESSVEEDLSFLMEMDS